MKQENIQQQEQVKQKIVNYYTLTLAIVIILDLITTYIGISLDLNEANPAGLTKVYVFGILTAIFLIFVSFFKPKLPRWIEWFLLVPIVFRIFVIIWNLGCLYWVTH